VASGAMRGAPAGLQDVNEFHLITSTAKTTAFALERAEELKLLT